MRDSWRPIGLTLLGLLTLAVLIATIIVLTQYPKAPVALSVLTQSTSASSTPSLSAEPLPTRPRAAVLQVLVAGPDLAGMRQDLAKATGDVVGVLDHAAPAVLAPGALDGAVVGPDVVILQVLAGSTTTVRTRVALAEVRTTWPKARIYVVGPFSSADRKSAAAVRVAATEAQATFLDPVALSWRADDAPATLDPAERGAVAGRLAAALAT